jgi:hypothetical protein
MAMNKDEVKAKGIGLIQKIEKRISDARKLQEEGWNIYNKRK